jgi:hypothetical protein
MDELTRLEPMSSEVSDVAAEISDALGESLSTICARYFGDNDEGEVDQVLVEERDRL